MSQTRQHNPVSENNSSFCKVKKHLLFSYEVRFLYEVTSLEQTPKCFPICSSWFTMLWLARVSWFASQMYHTRKRNIIAGNTQIRVQVFLLTAPTSLLSRPMPKATVATTCKNKYRSVIMKLTCHQPAYQSIHTYIAREREIFLTTLILFEQNSSCIRLRSFEGIELW